MSNEKKEAILGWISRTFTLFIPCGFALWTFVIEKLFDNEVSIMAKVGVSGIFLIAVMFIIAVFFYGKHLKKKIQKITKDIIVCMNTTEKAALILKLSKEEAKQELFSNACFFAPFVLIYFILMLVEKKVMDLRGIFGTISISMAVGLGFNGWAQWLHTKNAKSIDEQ